MANSGFLLGDDEFDEFEIKLTILGDSDVGKTNLLLRFIENRFEAYSAPTIGFDYLFKRVEMNYKKNVSGTVVDEKEPVLLKIFDTAGQERFRSLTKTHFQGTQGFLLVYDISRRSTFDHIKTWHGLTQENKTANTLVKYLLVGNKRDLADERQITEEEGQDFAKQFDMMFMETSAKTNEDNRVERAFNTFIDAVIEELKPDILVVKMARDKRKNSQIADEKNHLDAKRAQSKKGCC